MATSVSSGNLAGLLIPLLLSLRHSALQNTAAGKERCLGGWFNTACPDEDQPPVYQQ